MSTVLFMKDEPDLKVGVGTPKAYQGQSGGPGQVVPGATVIYPTLDGTAQQSIGPSTYTHPT
jgi:hypothetical protein